MGFAWRILFIESIKLRLENSESRKCRLPLCSNEKGLTLMCWRVRAMNKVRLFLTTHPSKVNSRFGTLRDASGPFSLFNTVVEKFLIRMPKNWIIEPWLSCFRVNRQLRLTCESIIVVGGRYCRRLLRFCTKKSFERFAISSLDVFFAALYSVYSECFCGCVSRLTSCDWITLTSSSSMHMGFLCSELRYFVFNPISPTVWKGHWWMQIA